MITGSKASEGSEPWRSDPWRLSPEALQAKFRIPSSRINIPLFESRLVGYNQAEADYVMHGIRFGFSMGMGAGPYPPPKLWAASFLTNDQRLVITAHLADEVSEGRIVGPFLTVPRGLWAKSWCHPMSIAFKHDGSPRIISNMSADGKLLSVNGFIPKSEKHTAYPSFLQVAREMYAVGLDRV